MRAPWIRNLDKLEEEDNGSRQGIMVRDDDNYILGF